MVAFYRITSISLFIGLTLKMKRSEILCAIRESRKIQSEKGTWTLGEDDLLEMGPEIIPDLIEIYRDEPDTVIREFLVEVICGFKQADVIPFLSEVLRYDEDPINWETVLEGLVWFASPEAVEALRSARTRVFSDAEQTEKFRKWLKEAIVKVEEEIRQLDPKLPTIYVELKNVKEDLWIPVKAEYLEDNIYKIVSENLKKDCEEWQFTAGEVVRCKEMDLFDAFGNDDSTFLRGCLVAIERINQTLKSSN